MSLLKKYNIDFEEWFVGEHSGHWFKRVKNNSHAFIELELLDPNNRIKITHISVLPAFYELNKILEMTDCKLPFFGSFIMMVALECLTTYQSVANYIDHYIKMIDQFAAFI